MHVLGRLPLGKWLACHGVRQGPPKSSAALEPRRVQRLSSSLLACAGLDNSRKRPCPGMFKARQSLQLWASSYPTQMPSRLSAQERPGFLVDCHGLPARKISGSAPAVMSGTPSRRRRLPACLHQWTETQCLSWSRWSPHSGLVCAVRKTTICRSLRSQSPRCSARIARRGALLCHS